MRIMIILVLSGTYLVTIRKSNKITYQFQILTIYKLSYSLKPLSFVFRYRYEDDDVSDMETNYASIMREEARRYIYLRKQKQF